MSCSCSIDAYQDGYYGDFMRTEMPTARKVYRCCECRREIAIGEKYERVVGKWEGGFTTYKTCLDCVSIREAFFCSFIFTNLFSDLKDNIECNDAELSQDCIAKLTPGAKEMVLEMIDEYISEREKD